MENNLEQKVNLIKNNKENLEKSLLVLKKGKKKIQKGVFLGKNVKLETNIFFDTSSGDIVIGDGTKIKANAVLRGPLTVGRDCVINSFSEISSSQIGDVCKIGGEVEGSIIQNYTNKQHYGCLGHSYVGSWVNIGAGTSVSDLKNTYSTIRVQGVDTGMQFLGPIIGDYVKTAINTSIFCGKVIGPSAHLYGLVATDVPAFTSHVSTGNLYELSIDLAKRIQKVMMKRRGLEFGQEDHDKFEELFKNTELDRKNAKAKKEKLKF